MKMRISMVADLSLIPSIVTGVALGKIDAETLQIEPVFNNGGKTTTLKAIPKAVKTKQERKGPQLNIPDRVLAAVRKLNRPGGAPLHEIRNMVKATSVSPVITDLIKKKKLVRVSNGHYKVT